MRAAIIAAMLLAVTLAGCAEGTEPVTSNDEEVFEDFEAEATSTTGVIRGVVVDQAIVPLDGAVVKIKSLGLEATTNEEGAFAFSDLEPGSYFLEASKVGYTPIQTSAMVEAGVDKPPVVRIALTFDPESQPLIMHMTFNGFIKCSTVTVVLRLAACAVPGLVGLDLGDDFITYVDTVEGDHPAWVQSELVWKSTQPTGDRLNMGNFGGSASQVGSSPVVIMRNGTYWSGGDNYANDSNQIAWRVFAGPMDGTDVGGLWGLGVVVEQKFDMYITQMYNHEPHEGYTFVEEGMYEPPQ